MQLGPTNIVRAAILAGQIDLYPEYTGNGAFFFHRESRPGMEGRRRRIRRGENAGPRREPSRLAQPAPANNTWVIAIRGDLPGFPERKCLDDLAAWLRDGGRLKLAASAEFVESAAALPAFEQTYGFHLRSDQLLTLSGGNTAATLRAAAEGISGVNAGMAYGTDGELAALGLIALCDDKGAQIVYAPAPVVRDSVLKEYQQIAAALDPVFAQPDAGDIAGAERPHRGQWRGCRRRGARLSSLAAFSAVIRNRVLPLLFAAAALAVAGSGLSRWRRTGCCRASRSGCSPLAIGGSASRSRRSAWRCSRPRWCRRAGPCIAPPRCSPRALLLLVMAASGEAAASLATTVPALARISLGAAFWVLAGAAALAIIDLLQRAAAGTGERLAVAAIVIAGFAIMAQAGLFDALSLAREYRTREASFAAALIRHVELVAASVGAALLIGFPLGIAAVRRPHWQGPVFAVLNLLQTIPSIALFGLLIVPLSALAAAAPSLAALGVAGIGPAPAIVALILYALLPVVRNTVAGIAGVDPAIVDAARGMGMNERQLFRQVQLPLAMPLLLAGLRIVTVQTIGLAVVAALIGAGGLGTFVFAGLGQYAADLVLLGALPTIALALAADFLLQFADRSG